MKQLLLACCLFISCMAIGQVKYSFATDVSGIRNFSPRQKFWGFGQTIQANFHFSKKETAFVWLMYHTPGRFTNEFLAKAKSASTNPNVFPYSVKGIWNMKEFSLGWKHYFKGSFDAETGTNLYGIAGLGILLSNVENTLLTVVDTAVYEFAANPVFGNSNFRRLTIDLGLGAEKPLGGNFYIYGDVRTFLPVSSYPSPYLHSYDQVPFPLTLNLGVRILFDFSY